MDMVPGSVVVRGCEHWNAKSGAITFIAPPGFAVVCVKCGWRTDRPAAPARCRTFVCQRANPGECGEPLNPTTGRCEAGHAQPA